MYRYFNEYRARLTPRERVRIWDYPTNTAHQYISRNNAVQQSTRNQSHEQRSENTNRLRWDVHAGPHRVHDNDFHPTVRFRTTRDTRWINDGAQDEHHRFNNFTYQYRQYNNTQPRQDIRPRALITREDDDTWRYTRSDTHHYKNAEFPYRERQFINSQYKRQENRVELDNDTRRYRNNNTHSKNTNFPQRQRQFRNVQYDTQGVPYNRNAQPPRPVFTRRETPHNINRQRTTYYHDDTPRTDGPLQRKHYSRDGNGTEYTPRWRNEQNNKRERPQKGPRTRPQRYFTQPSDPTPSAYTPATPKLKNTIKLVYDLLRLEHQLKNIDVQKESDTPITFKRLQTHLITTIKPLLPNERVNERLTGNARNWMYTTQLILREHYQLLIQQKKRELIAHTDRADWPHALDIATRWANKNLQNKIQPTTFEKIETFLTETNERNTSRDTENGDPPAPNTNQTHARTHKRKDDPPATRAKSGAQHVHVQTSPAAPPPSRGDWSFDEEFPPLAPPAGITPTIIHTTKPLPQRTARRLNTDLLVDIETPQNKQTAEQKAPTEQPKTTHEQLSTHTTVEKNKTNEKEDTTGQSRHTSDTTATTRPPTTHVDRATSPSLYSEDSTDDDYATYTVNAAHRTSPTLETENEQRDSTRTEETENTTHDTENTSTALATPRKDTHTLVTPSTPKSVGRPYKHIKTDKKHIDWSLNLKKRCVIIGDSNVARIPSFDIVELQVDSFPGAKFQHAGYLVEKATIAMEPEVLMLSFGINNRTQRCISTTEKEILRTYKTARARLPHTEIIVPLINFSQTLPEEEKAHLTAMNKYIRDNLHHVSALPSRDFRVENDMIHWTAGTARALLEHWMYFLDLEGQISQQGTQTNA